MTDPLAPTPTPYSAPSANVVPANTPADADKFPVLGVIAMISGILGIVVGIFGWGLLLSIGGIVLGHISFSRERAAKSFWLTGLITGYVGVLINIIVLVGVFVLFGLALSVIPQLSEEMSNM